LSADPRSTQPKQRLVVSCTTSVDIPTAFPRSTPCSHLTMTYPPVRRIAPRPHNLPRPRFHASGMLASRASTGHKVASRSIQGRLSSRVLNMTSQLRTLPPRRQYKNKNTPHRLPCPYFSVPYRQTQASTGASGLSQVLDTLHFEHSNNPILPDKRSEYPEA
jgi:hypothetical protein